MGPHISHLLICVSLRACLLSLIEFIEKNETNQLLLRREGTTERERERGQERETERERETGRGEERERQRDRETER